MNKAWNNFKTQFEENPVAVAVVAASVATVLVKIVEAGVSANNSRTWKKEVNRRNRKTK